MECSAQVVSIHEVREQALLQRFLDLSQRRVIHPVVQLIRIVQQIIELTRVGGVEDELVRPGANDPLSGRADLVVKLPEDLIAALPLAVHGLSHVFPLDSDAGPNHANAAHQP